jgi:hypothetical protein
MRLVLAAIAALAIGAGAAPALASQAHFMSPSGNINCRVFSATGGIAQCVLLHDSWRRHPHRPSSCNLDWVPNEIELVGTKVHVGACRGDIGPLCSPTAGDTCTVLDYGTSIRIGRIRCKSTTRGITCRRVGGHHQGFFISRQRYKLYK